MTQVDPPPVSEQDVRAPRLAIVGLVLVAVTIVAAVIGVIVAIARLGDDDESLEPIEATLLIADAQFPVALTPTGDGGFLYAEKVTGKVRRVGPDGTLDPVPVAAFEVNSDRQRGLVGMVDIGGELFVSFVRAVDDRLVITRVADGVEIWVGPSSTDLANGGTLLDGGEGTIVVGVGDLQDRAARDRDDTLNGKLLRLDANGAPDQEPEVISAGWNNPFALAVTADGSLWVADNAPGSEPERLGRGTEDASEAFDLVAMRAPSALAELADGTLIVCGFISSTLDVLDVRDGDVSEVGTQITPCRTGVAVLADGRVVTATEEAIFVTTIPTN